VELDQTIDGRTATAAGSACAAGLADFVTTSSAGIDALSNRSVVDRMAVANQHALYLAREKLQIKFNNR
jgi:hypothetical protein